MAEDRLAAAYELLCIRGLGLCNRDPPLLKFTLANGKNSDRLKLPPAGDHQRRFRQAVAGVERLPAKSARCKRCGKAIERLWPHRLRTGKRHLPAAQIQ